MLFISHRTSAKATPLRTLEKTLIGSRLSYVGIREKSASLWLLICMATLKIPHTCQHHLFKVENIKLECYRALEIRGVLMITGIFFLIFH